MNIIHIPHHRFDLTYQYLLPVLTKTQHLYQDNHIRVQEVSISDEREGQEGVIFRGDESEPKPFVAYFRKAIVIGWCESGDEEECVRRIERFLERTFELWRR